MTSCVVSSPHCVQSIILGGPHDKLCHEELELGSCLQLVTTLCVVSSLWRWNMGFEKLAQQAVSCRMEQGLPSYSSS